MHNCNAIGTRFHKYGNLGVLERRVYLGISVCGDDQILVGILCLWVPGKN